MGTRLHRSKHGATVAARRVASIAAGVVVLLALGATVTVVAVHRADSRGSERPAGPAGTAGGAARKGARGNGPAPVAPIRLVSTTPAPGASGVGYAPTVTVELSAPLAPGSPLPSISPEAAGSWSASGATLAFHPDGQFPPWTAVRVTVPGGAAGVRGAGGARLPYTEESTFTVAGGSQVRLQQLLAELGYMPVSFVPAGPGASATSALGSEPTSPDLVPLSPLPGKFVWRFTGTPPLLEAAWADGSNNVVTRGAVMAFEAAHGLQVDGAAGPMVWNALLDDVAGRRSDPSPYDYISVQERLPQTLFVWQDGRTVLAVPANTGISLAPTAKGTYPVYVRYLVTTMTGKNPNGTVYHDPGIPHVAYFNGGDAIHGFVRAAYGFPQSLGCVELSYAGAAQVWPYDQLGTLVTVY